MDAITPAKIPDQSAKPVREPRVFLLRKGGIAVQGEDGQRIAVRLVPRELRALGNRLRWLATEIDGEQPSRIGEGWVDE